MTSRRGVSRGVGGLLAFAALGLFAVRFVEPSRRAPEVGAAKARCASDAGVAPEAGVAALPVRRPATGFDGKARPDLPAVRHSPPVLRVRFVDPLGIPLSGVQLRLAGHSPTLGTSGSDGHVQVPLTDILAGREIATLTLRATAPGRAVHERTVLSRGSLWLADWILAPGAEIRGFVRDGDGEGVAGAGVACLSSAEPSIHWEERRRESLASLREPGPMATTRGDGSFTLSGVPAGEVCLVAVHSGFEAGRSDPLGLAAGEVLHDVSLRLGARAPVGVAGLVVGPRGEPVSGALVRARSERTVLEARTDAQGRFALRTTDAATLIGVDPGGLLREALLENVRPGTTGLRLRLATGSTVDLVVTSADGEPLERFGWSLHAVDGGQLLRASPLGRRPGGTASVVLPRLPFTLDVQAKGWITQRLGPLDPATVPEILCARLACAGGVEGVVLHAGRPVAGAKAGLYRTVSGPTEYNGLRVHRATLPGSSATSASDGTFRLDIPERGRWFLGVDAPGFASAELGPFTLSPRSLRSELVELGRGGTLELRIHASGPGQPAGTLVVVSRGDGRGSTHRFGPEGVLLLEGLTPGRWFVALTDEEIDPRVGIRRELSGAPEEIPWTCAVRAGAISRFDLWVGESTPPSSELRGELTVDGRPAEGWWARLDGSDDFEPLPFEAPGIFRLAVESPGTYGLLLGNAERRVILDRVELTGSRKHWSLEIETGWLEDGSILPASGGWLTFHEWSRDSLCILTPLGPADGASSGVRVPRGRGRIVRYRATGGIDSQEPEVLAEVEVE